jgi:hypothetical protein
MPPGNPAMAGPPMGAMHSTPPPARPVRQGTSRAVPVVVSAGLAVGVFCGLLFGLGTDKEEASASTTASNGVKSTNDDSSATAPTPDKPKTDKPADKPKTDKPADKPTTPAAGSATPAAGSATQTAAAGSNAGAGSATQAGSASAPAKSVAKLTFDIKPDPGPQAKITVDGKDVTGTTFEVDLGTEKTKTVKVAITAPGFHSYEQKVDVKGETTVSVELAKRAPATYVHPPVGNGSGTPVKQNTGKDGKGKKPGGGVIDL